MALIITGDILEGQTRDYSNQQDAVMPLHISRYLLLNLIIEYFVQFIYMQTAAVITDTFRPHLVIDDSLTIFFIRGWKQYLHYIFLRGN